MAAALNQSNISGIQLAIILIVGFAGSFAVLCAESILAKILAVIYKTRYNNKNKVFKVYNVRTKQREN